MNFYANLMALAVARVRIAGWCIKGVGLTGHPTLVAYASDQAHSCHEQSMKLLGMREQQLRKIPVDSHFGIDLTALESVIQWDLRNGLKPFCIIANAGAVDPLYAIADIAQCFGL